LDKKSFKQKEPIAETLPRDQTSILASRRHMREL
jgi:hypothetical protein